MMTTSANLPGRGRVGRRTVLASTAAVAALAGPQLATAAAAPAVGPQGGPSDGLPREPIPAQVPQREGYLDVPGGRLWYWDTGGTGPAIVLSHPGSGSALVWPYQQPAFARAGYRVIAYSRRGHYNSTPPEPGNPGVGADDLAALVDHLKLDRFHLLGAALGGYYATDYALIHPERLLSLVIVSSFMGISDAEYLRTHRLLRPAGFADMPHSFQELSPYYRAANPEGAHTWSDLSDRSLGGHDVEDQVMSEPLTWARLETLSVRTLLIAGDADLYWPPPIMRMVADHLPAARMLVYGKVGHAANWERPSELNRDVLRFFGGARFPRATYRP